jgi:hypothetical protein
MIQHQLPELYFFGRLSDTYEVTACPTGLDAKVYLDGRPTGSRKLDSNGVPLAYEIGRVRAERVAEPGML